MLATAILRAQAPAPAPANPPSGDKPQDPAPAAAPAQETPWIRGQLSSRYWLRWTGSASDQDLYETLALDLGDDAKSAVSGHFFGRLAADIDGRGDGSRFTSLADRSDRAVTTRVYDAYADLHRVPGLELVRIGRQVLHDTPVMAWFDGARAETVPIGKAELQFGAYGGQSSHIYESSPHGDWTAGAYGQARPWTGGRVRLDWMRVRDDELFGVQNNDLLGASVWQNFGERVQTDVAYTRLDGRDRDVRAHVGYNDNALGLRTEIRWYELLHPQRDRVVELDPFFEALHELYPYWQLGLLVGKTVGENFELQVGADFRQVADPDRVGEFNRDFARYYATVQEHDLPIAGLTASATADVWNSSGQDVVSWGADLAHKLQGGKTSIAAGTWWSLYKFDIYLDSEREHVRTWFLRLRHSPCPSTTLEAGYEIEESSVGEYQSIRLGVTWKF